MSPKKVMPNSNLVWTSADQPEDQVFRYWKSFLRIFFSIRTVSIPKGLFDFFETLIVDRNSLVPSRVWILGNDALWKQTLTFRMTFA